MFIDMLQIVLIVLTASLAMLTVELKDMLHAVVALCGMCISIGALFWLLNAPYVAALQLLVYAGAVIVLFLATVMLTARGKKSGDEKRETDWIRAAGLAVTILTTLVFSMVIIRYEFPVFGYAASPTKLVEVTPLIGQETSRFLWTYRLIDLIAQAFVLFAAAACCVAILRTEKEEEK